METTMDKPKMTPKDFFMYFGTALTLYATAGALLALLFDIINAVVPDALNPNYGGSWAGSGMRFAISTLIVAFPLYIVLSWLIRKDIIGNVAKYQLSVRKWFVYFTLFIAGATIAGDIIALINTYLNGEVSTRFVWKILAVLVVAGVIFWYYIYDIRRASRGDTSVNKSIIVLAVIGMLAAIVGGFVATGSPAQVRALKFDETRVSNLQDIQWQVTNHYQRTGLVPETLDELSNDISGYHAPVDPSTNESYEYIKTGELTFQLCATFAQSNKDSADTPAVRSPYGEGNDTFIHDVGRTCFDRTINPSQYPLIKQ